MAAKIRNTKRLLLTVIIAALLLVVAGVILFVYSWPAITVGKYSYNRHDYEALVKDIMKNDVKSREDAQKLVRQELAARAAADDLQLPYTTDRTAINQAAQEVYDLDDTVKPTERQRLGTYALLAEPALNVVETGGYHVGIINFPFSRYLTGFFGDRFGDGKLIGNVKAIRDDMAYAKEQQQKYQDELTKGTSIEEVVANVKKDPRLVFGQTSNQSRAAFVTDTKVEQEYYGANGDIVDETRFNQIKEAAAQMGKPKQYELTYDADAKLDYGVDMPDLKRGGVKTLVGWSLIVVDKRIDKQADIRSRYDQLVKEYVDGKK